MTDAALAFGATKARPATLSTRIMAAISRAAARFQARRTAAALELLTNRQLEDIGLTRADIDLIANGDKPWI